jgi:hypothetical protein
VLSLPFVTGFGSIPLAWNVLVIIGVFLVFAKISFRRS